MINDLKVPNVPIWKYVDDMSIAEKEPKGALSNAQAAVTSVQNWSRKNNLKLHPGKCKELIVDFSKNKQVFDPITVDGVRIPVVSKATLLGLTISNNLLGNDHVTETIKKANKRLYSLVLLKRTGVPLIDFIVQQLDLSWNTVHQFFTTHCLSILVLKLRGSKKEHYRS